MSLTLQSFTALVRQQAAAVQQSCAALLDLTVGSVLRAILEANAGVALWMQWLILQVLALTRAATSNGSDLDTWMADYAFLRLPAQTAAGQVTFARFSTATAALIVPGATVKTADGSQSFTVTTDTTNPLWSAGQGGYLLAVGIASGTVPVQATVAGAAGNVQAGTITLIASAISGVDTVTNAAPTANGADAETDAAFRARFVLYIAGLSKATEAAIASAIAGVRQGLTWSIQPNVNPDGSAHVGNFVVTVDDGTGAPSSDLLSAVYAAVDAVRAIGTTFAVQAPTVVTANVSMTITAAPGFVKTALQGPVADAVTGYIDELGLEAALQYLRIPGVAYSIPGVATVESLLVNGGTADIGGGVSQSVRAGTVAVN